MGNIGRLLPEGDWPHSADWNSIWFALSGMGYVMPVGGECAPSKTSALEVTVTDGQISVGLPDVYSFGGDSVTLSSNESSPDPRYDLIYLEYDDTSGNVVLRKEEGTPDEHPKHPDLPLPPSRKVVPVAVIYFEPYASEITVLKNSRTVLDPAHEHTSGAGLNLTDDAVMEVNADETTITTANGPVELMEGAIEFSHLDLTMGDGIEGIDTDSDSVIDTLQLDLKNYGGLAFEAGELKVDPSDFDGDGLEVDGNNDLQVTAGDGLFLSNERLKLDIGDGLVLDGTTPDRVLKVDLLTNGGLQFNSGDLEVNPADFDGDGLGIDANNDLVVKAGDGITLSSDTVKADVSTDHGLELVGTNPDKKIAVDLETGGGLGFTDAGGNIEVVPADIAGDGLADSGTGNLEVNSDDLDGDGLTVDDFNNLMVNVSDFDGDGLTVDGNNNLQVQVSDFDEGGLGVDGNNNLVVKAGNGISIVADRVTVDPGAGLKFDGSSNSTPDKPLMVDLKTNGGLRMSSEELAVDPADFAGSGLEGDGSYNLQVKDGNGLELSSGYVRVKPSDLDGNGLGSTSTSLSVKTGDGLTINSDYVEVDAGQGLTANATDVHASLGNGLGFDGSDRIEIDALADGGIGFSGGEVKVDAGDINLEDLGNVDLVVDTSADTSSRVGWSVSDGKPAFVCLAATDDQNYGDRLRWYVEDHDTSNYIVWVENMDGDHNTNFDIKIYAITN